MKFFIVLFMAASVFTISNARAGDLLFCQSTDSLSSKSLRVFNSASDSSYEFELYLSHKFSHEPSGPYATGEVVREGMTFRNENISIFHIYGGYVYMDSRDGSDIRFSDSDCIVTHDSQATVAADFKTSNGKILVQGTGEIGGVGGFNQGGFGDCLSPNPPQPYAYLGYPEASAKADASQT